MIPVPTNLAIVDERTLRIDWSDGQQRLYAFRVLRDSCPCAGCRESRNEESSSSSSGSGAPSPPANPLQLTVLSPAETLPIRVVSMRPVGNYAYSILFSDGHDSGIFTFEFLLSLGTSSSSSSSS